MTEEFNLSDKEYWCDCFTIQTNVIKTEDVKEFIKRLKEVLCVSKEEIGDNDVKAEIAYIIDKLAGDKLI